MKPNYFTIAMYPTVSINQEEILGRLLDVFDSNEKFAPTHWGNSETVRVEYNREEILEKVILGRKVSEVHLYRDKAVHYRGSFKVNWSHRSYLEFEFHKSIPKSLWSAFFELSDQIAEIVKPRFGRSSRWFPPAGKHTGISSSSSRTPGRMRLSWWITSAGCISRSSMTAG